jgi:hypothetical protein
MGEKRNGYRDLVGKPEEKKNILEVVGVKVRIILE